MNGRLGRLKSPGATATGDPYGSVDTGATITTSGRRTTVPFGGFLEDGKGSWNNLMNDYGHEAYRWMDWERQYTFDEYMELPDPLKRMELHDGHLYLRPLEYIYIIKLKTRICEVLEATVGEASACCRPSLPFQPPGNNLWVAAVGLVSSERWETAVTKDDYLGLAPELVVEIVWEERPIDEINKLMPVAMSNGCQAFWIVDPAQKSVLDVRADASRRHGPGDELKLPKPWSEYTVTAGTLFEAPER